MKRLVFITGTRADYGKLEPLAIKSLNLGFEVHFFVTGMHLLERYGLTSIEVARNKEFKRREFSNQNEGDNQDQILANTINGFSDYLNQTRPDLVLIHGDRVEALAASLVCSTNYIRSAHIEGGEISGTIDEIYRHCNTKLCTVHLVSSAEAKSRVVQLGEHPDRVFIMGSPELDTHSKPSGISIDEVRARYDIPWKEFGIAIFHPVTSESAWNDINLSTRLMDNPISYKLLRNIQLTPPKSIIIMNSRLKLNRTSKAINTNKIGSIQKF